MQLRLFQSSLCYCCCCWCALRSCVGVRVQFVICTIGNCLWNICDDCAAVVPVVVVTTTHTHTHTSCPSTIAAYILMASPTTNTAPMAPFLITYCNCNHWWPGGHCGMSPSCWGAQRMHNSGHYPIWESLRKYYYYYCGRMVFWYTHKKKIYPSSMHTVISIKYSTRCFWCNSVI